MTKRLLIIPARKGSARIKNKNIKSFLGLPIIAYSIISGKKSKLFKKIHVSTDSKKIKKISEKYGAKCEFLRPRLLSGPNVPIFTVLKSVVRELKKKDQSFDEVWCLLPCSPLINFNDLKKISIGIKKKTFFKPLMTVAKYPAPIEWAFKIKKRFKLDPINGKKFLYPSQKFKEVFFDTGTLYVFNVLDLLRTKTKNIYKSFYGYKLAPDKAIDIDNIDDWNLALKLKKLDNIKLKK
tara:strand:+ start:2224 stop:2934 length:711 start_codon:yes stop_codon:yes gene_type:complete